MSKRLQVLLEDGEYELVQAAARRRGMTLTEWVRQALRAAWREEPSDSVDRKVAAIRAAMRHSFPAPPMDQMLDEIGRGYRSENEK